MGYGYEYSSWKSCWNGDDDGYYLSGCASFKRTAAVSPIHPEYRLSSSRSLKASYNAIEWLSPQVPDRAVGVRTKSCGMYGAVPAVLAASLKRRKIKIPSFWLAIIVEHHLTLPCQPQDKSVTRACWHTVSTMLTRYAINCDERACIPANASECRCVCMARGPLHEP